MGPEAAEQTTEPVAVSSSLPDARPGEIEAVRGIFLALERAVRVVQMYPSNNKVYIEITQGFADALQQFVKEYGDLEVSVREEGFVYLERIAHQEANQSRSLAMQLYRDGVRRLGFYPGLENDEVLGLLDVFATPVANDDLDADIVTLLWERDFTHITYYVVDTSILDETPVNLARSLTGLDLHSALEEEEEEEEAKTGGGCRYIPPKLAGRTLATIMMISDADLETVRVLLQREEARNLYRDLTTLLFEMLNVRAEEDTFRSSVAVLGDLAISYVKSERIADAVEILTRFKELSDTDLEETHGKILAREVERVGGAETTSHLKQRFKRPILKDRDAIVEFLRLLGPGYLPQLTELCTRATEPQPIAEVIFELSGGTPHQFIEKLNDPDPTVVRQMVAVLGATGYPELAEEIVRHLAHEAVSVRLEVVRVLGTLSSDLSRKGLLKAIANSEYQVRIQALRALAQREDATTLPFLFQAIDSRSFSRKSVNEREEYFRTIARIGGDAVVPVLSRHLDRRAFMNRRIAKENRIAAAKALASIPTERSKEVLVKRLGSNSREVREACEEALRRLQGEMLGLYEENLDPAVEEF